MDVILACLIIAAIVIIAAWKYYSVKRSIVTEPIAPYKVAEPATVVPVPEPVIEAVAPAITEVVTTKPAKIKVKKQKAPAVAAEAVVEPVKVKRVKSKKA